MVSLTHNEKEALLILFKEYTTLYNANMLSKRLHISHVGTQKLLKRLKEEELVISKEVGKAIIYRPNMKNEYAEKLITFLLVDEANKYQRWKDEFRELYKKGRIIMIYGSILKNYDKATDIDIMLVINQNEVKEIDKILHGRQEILPKKIHALKLTEDDLLKNITKKQEATVDIIKNAIILYGEDKYVEVVKNVAGF